MADGGVYGDMLSSFPELFSEHVVFQMEALPGGGWGARHDSKTIDGIFRGVPGGKMQVMGENRERNDIATFWLYEDDADRIEEGSFIQRGKKLYVLTKGSDYLREGGFAEFSAALVAGPTDMQVPDKSVISRAVDGYK